MKAPKHTKGPWRFEKNYYHDRFNLRSEYRETFIGDITIDRAHADFKPEEAQANAHLIAAAPTMIETLEFLLADENTDLDYEARMMIESAIKRARGNS